MASLPRSTSNGTKSESSQNDSLRTYVDAKTRLKMKFLLFVSVIFLYLSSNLVVGVLKRCFVCRSRGELGSCKDPFTWNVTQIENEKGIETIPCASGWCGKILETENAQKEEYGVATQRICLQRGPSDSEDRCAYTKWQHRKVLMCFCRGDLCNTSNTNLPTFLAVIITSLIILYRTL